MEIALNGVIDGEILSLDVTKFVQALLEGAPSWSLARKSQMYPMRNILGRCCARAAGEPPPSRRQAVL